MNTAPNVTTLFASSLNEGVSHAPYCPIDRFLSDIVCLYVLYSIWKIIVSQTVTVDADEYCDYFEFVNHPSHRLRAMTVLFEGGFELTVRV